MADSENPRRRQYSRQNLGACKAVMIDTVVDDYVTANGHRRCCIDAIARSVFLQDKETKNHNESSEFLFAHEEEERKED